MGANLILPFAQSGGANVLTQSAYAADSQLPVGNQPGVARSAFVNKALLQQSAIAAGVAQFLADSQAADITDQLTPATLSTIFRNALNGVTAFITQTAGDSSNRPATTAFVQTAISGAVGAGAIGFFPATAAPAGYLKMNGALLSRVTYAGLWAYAQASGNMAASDGAWTSGQFSPGDGSTTFRIPDLRGYHIRAFDDARGLDSGRVIGSTQADQFPSHVHTLTDPGHSHSMYDPGHVHPVNDPGHSHPTGSEGAGSPSGASLAAMGYGAAGSTGASGTGIYLSSVGTGVATYAAGVGLSVNAAGAGTETRVKNIAFLGCIKY